MGGDVPAPGRDPGRVREEFLTAGASPRGDVPAAVADSWERSRRCGVDPDRLWAPYEEDLVDRHGRLAHTGLGVFEHFAGQLDGTATCLAFADREARGIEVAAGQPGLRPVLERYGMRAGFRFAEDIVGTNGVGTVAETGEPIRIGPGQHFVRPLLGFSCAGAPVRHPFTGRLEAVVNLTTPHEDRSGLLLPFVLEIARRMEERLFEQGSAAERLLLQHFMATSKGSSRGVVVVSEDMILANALGTQLLEGVPQTVLWEHAARAMADRLSAVHELSVDESEPLLVRCFPINAGGKVIGATLELERAPAPAPRRSRQARRLPELPDLVGRSAAWRRVCQEARHQARRSSELRCVVAGEAGVGKLSVARAMWATGSAPVEPDVFDAALQATEGESAWVGRIRDRLGRPGGAVILSHVDALSEAGVRSLGAVIDQLSPGAPAILATICVGNRPVTHCAPLLDRIGVTRIDIPPLRQRREDIPDLVAALLERLAGPRRRCRPEALQAITRFSWPGNVRQLETALRAAVLHAEQEDIRVDHLPPEIRRGGVRRRLTPMEQAELDAILQALGDAHGNKVEAAARLGIARSTLYRKLRAYGLDPDQIVF